MLVGCSIKMASCSNSPAPKKKRLRHGARYQMQLTFPDEETKTAFLSRLERAKSVLSSKKRRAIDNFELIDSMLNQVSEQVSFQANRDDSTSAEVPKMTKPMLKSSGIQLYRWIIIVN